MVVSHASGACVKLDPYGPQLAVNSCIIFEVDDLALAVCWLDALAEVGHRVYSQKPLAIQRFNVPTCNVNWPSAIDEPHDHVQDDGQDDADEEHGDDWE